MKGELCAKNNASQRRAPASDFMLYATVQGHPDKMVRMLVIICTLPIE
jgi:hypothetical protein